MSTGTAPHDQSLTPVYSMLGSGSCDTPLPQNPIVRELSFGRFIASTLR